MGAKKTDLARSLVRDRGFRIGAVAKALSIARSNLYERLENPVCVRQPRKNVSDGELLQKIMAIVDERPTYGYRRICAVLTRQLKESGLPAVNHKRIYRLMKQNDLEPVSIKNIKLIEFGYH